MEEEKILNVTQLQVVDKIQAEDVILLIRDTGNGKQCFQIKGFDFRGESAYEAALKQGFVGTYQDWTQHIKEITKYKPKPKTQYIIGKSIPIGKLDGGTRLNAYIVTSNIFRFKLTNVPQLEYILSDGDTYGPAYERVDDALADVTWHLFVNDMEIPITNRSTTCYGRVLQLEIFLRHFDAAGFYQLDESKSSVDLSSDMYIYLRKVLNLENDLTFKGTSKTLYYNNGRRIWEPTTSNPYISDDVLYSSHRIELQRLYTRQRRSKRSGEKITFSTRMYRGRYGDKSIGKFGVYRYRLLNAGKKTQWRTINIMKTDKGYLIK